MFTYLRTAPLQVSRRFTQVRHASLIVSADNQALVKFLGKLGDFDRKKKIFNKLDELYLLCKRKGFHQTNNDIVRLYSNNKELNTTYKNLCNLCIVNQATFANSLAGVLDPGLFSAITQQNAPFKIQSIAQEGIPGVSVFSLNRNLSQLDKYVDTWNNLERKDADIRKSLYEMINAFKDEDVLFLYYVLMFWLARRTSYELLAGLKKINSNGTIDNSLLKNKSDI